MTDTEIAAEIQNRGLEMEYLRELVASLGYDLRDGFDPSLPEALARATPEQRRHAALRTLNLGD